MSKLKSEREKAGYSIDYVADRLNIRKAYLLALEDEKYDALPGQIYAKGYTKMYHEFLGIDVRADKDGDFFQVQGTTCSDRSNLETGYNKYIIFCSVILLVLVIFCYKSLL